MKQCSNCNKIYGDSDYYCLKCNYPLKMVDISKVSEDEISDVLRHEKAINNPTKMNNVNSNVPKCPICRSINIHKISKLNKISRVITIGLYAVGNLSKTFKCDNCGMKF